VQLSRHIDPEQLIMLAVCVMISAAVGVSILNAGPDLGGIKFLAVAGVIGYLGLLLTYSRWARPGGRRLHAVAFFFAMFLATAWIMATLVQLGVLGAGVLIFMPLVALAAGFFAWRGQLVVIAVAGLQFLAAAWLLDNGPGLLLEALAGFGAATVFVSLFVHLARREAVARAEAEELSARLWEKLDQAEALATERERVRVAREIHDGLGHNLMNAMVQLEVARNLVAADPRAASGAIGLARTCVKHGLAGLRTAVSQLRQSPLEDMPLSEGIARLAADLDGSGVAVRYECQGIPRVLGQAATLCLYRGVQEGLNNIRKHAAARHAAVILDYSETDHVVVTISDDGTGPTDTTGSGFGLIGLAERARLAGGTLTAGRTGQHGFRLHLELPG
jgi:signal transduction histidine kinase